MTRTFKEAIVNARRRLSEACVTTPGLDAELLLAHLLEKDRAFVLARMSETAPGEIMPAFESNDLILLVVISGLGICSKTSCKMIMSNFFFLKAKLSNDQDSYLYYFKRQTTVEYVDANLNTSASDTGIKKIETTVYWYNPMSFEEQNYILTTLTSQK